jgi:hypothetical protein
MMIEHALSPPSGNDRGSRAQLLAMLGREDLRQRGPDAPICPPLVRDGVVVDPRDEIVRLAMNAQVVAINEAHDSPQDRAFIADIAQRLRPLGFSIYAAETLSIAATEPGRTWPQADDGYYTREPVFGALLRQARALNYRIVAYENFVLPEEGGSAEERAARREEGQARNIVMRIFDQEPEARVLIHAGYGHVTEHEDAAFGPMMARRLKDMTHIDPLTIDMTRYAAPGADYVVCAPTPRSVDIRLGAPAVTFEHGRPAWRIRAGQRPVAIPAAMIHADENTIIEARPISDPIEAVPADRILLRPGEILPLLLAPGRYRIESWTRNHGWSASAEVNVD